MSRRGAESDAGVTGASQRITAQSPWLAAGFLRSCATNPGAPALWVDGRTWTYGELFSRARTIAATLQRRLPDGGAPLTAVFAHRSVTGYAGILGALMAGTGYVPLNRTYPIERTRWMLCDADCRALVAGGLGGRRPAGRGRPGVVAGSSGSSGSSPWVDSPVRRRICQEVTYGVNRLTSDGDVSLDGNKVARWPRR